MTLSGTAKVIPRSWQSEIEYLSWRSTGLPQMSHFVTRFLFTKPHSVQVTVSSCGWSVMILAPQLVQVMRRYSRPLSSPHLHCQSPIAYLTKSSEQVSRKSENGKMPVNTDCRPWFARSSGSRFICRKRS